MAVCFLKPLFHRMVVAGRSYERGRAVGGGAERAGEEIIETKFMVGIAYGRHVEAKFLVGLRVVDTICMHRKTSYVYWTFTWLTDIRVNYVIRMQ